MHEKSTSRGLAVFEEPYVSSTTSPNTHTLKAGLLKSTAARFSRLFDQQVRPYIHKLTPLDLRSPCARILARNEEFQTVFFVSVGARPGFLGIKKERCKLDAVCSSSVCCRTADYRDWHIVNGILFPCYAAISCFNLYYLSCPWKIVFFKDTYSKINCISWTDTLWIGVSSKCMHISIKQQNSLEGF